MVDLVHVVYASEAAVPFNDQAVRDLLAGARRRNAEVDVTGILLLVDRSFFQILEGAPDAVDKVFERIGLDKRHRKVVKLIREPIEERDFRDWSMGVARVTSKEIASLPGFNDFFTAKRKVSDLGDGLARKLLEEFRRGRWRARVGD